MKGFPVMLPTKKIAAAAVHFGREYLPWAVRSVEEAVDEVHILYAPEPSYGFSVPGAVCPDTETQLHRSTLAQMKDPAKLRWHCISGTRTEAEHKNHFYRLCHDYGAPVALLFDADECWPLESARLALDYVLAQRGERPARRWLVDFTHYHRTFDWIVTDPFRPVRIIDVRVSIPEDDYLPREAQPLNVQHFSLVQSLPTWRYKLTCHSHSTELRERPRWLDDVFLKTAPGQYHPDLHPVVRELWRPLATPPELRAWLEQAMHDHPYYPNVDPLLEVGDQQALEERFP